MTEFDLLEQSVIKLHDAVNQFPIGAISLDDFKSVEEKIQTARRSLMHLNGRLLMLKTRCKNNIDKRREEHIEGSNDLLQRVISDTLIGIKAVKLCMHSITILTIFNSNQGSSRDQNELYVYMNKLFTYNDNIIGLIRSIEEAHNIQLNLKIEDEKVLSDHQKFLKEQEEIRNKELQEKYPEAVRNKKKMQHTLRKINIIKHLIRTFIAASDDLLEEEPALLEILSNHRELIDVETIVKMCQNDEDIENE